jgi:hypothetical protein
MDVQMRSVNDVPALIKYHAMYADGTVTHIHMDGQLDVLATECGLQSLKK